MHFIQLIVIITCILLWCDHIRISRYLSRLVLVFQFQFQFQFLFGSWQTKIQITNAKLTHEPTIIIKKKRRISHAANYQHVDGICIYVVMHLHLCLIFPSFARHEMAKPVEWTFRARKKKCIYIFFMLISLQFDDSSYKCERKKCMERNKQQLK